MRLLSSWLCLVGLAAAACGGAQAELSAQLAEQQTKLKAVNDAFEAQTRRIDGLKSRIEVLEDQVEAAKIHGGAPRALPVVRLAPAAGAASADAEDTEPAGDAAGSDDLSEGGGYVISQADVDALSAGGGGGGGGRSFPRSPVPPPANAAFAGNIGVAPVPGSAVPAVGARPPETVDPANDPVGTYNLVYAQYKNGDLAGAIAGFQKFVERWPDHSYSDNAIFLVGQARFERSELAGALAAFRRVVEVYPAGNKVPDALFMIGLTLDKLGRPVEGRETLTRLVSLYPGTQAAQRAQASLRGRPL